MEPSPLRIVSDGTGDTPVEWVLDGVVVGTTTDQVPLLIEVEAGHHELAAVSRFDGDWQVLARPEPNGTGVAYVDAWTARHEATPVAPGFPAWIAPAGLASLAAVLWLWPSRPKHP